MKPDRSQDRGPLESPKGWSYSTHRSFWRRAPVFHGRFLSVAQNWFTVVSRKPPCAGLTTNLIIRNLFGANTKSPANKQMLKYAGVGVGRVAATWPVLRRKKPSMSNETTSPTVVVSSFIKFQQELKRCVRRTTAGCLFSEWQEQLEDQLNVRVCIHTYVVLSSRRIINMRGI